MLNRITLLFLVLFPVSLMAQGNFNDFFTNGVFRFDYLLSGSSKFARVTEVQQKWEPFWGGTTKIAIEEQTLGNYRFNVRDLATRTVIYRQGFSPLFQEWQTTAEAKKMERAFYQVVRFPFPKSKVVLELECRNRDGKFQSIYSTTIDPSNYFISHEMPFKSNWVMLKNSGEPNRKVDIAILAEGYQKEEMGKFVKDAGRLVDSLFKVEPFASQQDKFNIYAVETPSAESGTDIPGRSIYGDGGCRDFLSPDAC